MHRARDGRDGLVSQTVGASCGLPVYRKGWRCDSGIGTRIGRSAITHVIN